MTLGNVPYDGGALLLDRGERDALLQESTKYAKFIKKFYGSAEFIRGIQRYCLWITEDRVDEAMKLPQVAARVSRVRQMRLASNDAGTRSLASRSHQMREMNKGRRHTIVVPRVSSENRPYLPVGLADSHTVIGDKNYAAYDAPYWTISLIASRIHLVWIATVCVRLRTDFSYGSTLGWNTFPVPPLTEQNKADLTRCAEDILLAREVHFPATIADLYDPETMPDNLRAAHERNDETLERIYIGRRFKNDTERLEKLFELYTKMTANAAAKKAAQRKKGERA
jgi:hypothetical protein